MKITRTAVVMLALAAVLISALAAGAQQQGPVTLRLKFQPNQVVKYRAFARVDGSVEAQMPQAGTGMPGAIPMQASITANLTTKTLGVDSTGSGRLSMRLDGLDMVMQLMGKNMKMKLAGGKLTMSADGQPVQSMPLMGMPGLPQGQKLPLVQEPITIKFDPRGRVTDVTIPGMPVVPGMDMRMLMQQNQFTFPEQAIGLGETWSEHQEVPLGGTPLVIDANYTLERLESKNGKSFATIRVGVNSRLDNADMGEMMKAGQAAGQPAPPVNMQGTMSMAQTLNGVLLFNVTAGQISRFDFEAGQQMASNSAMAMPNGGQQVNMGMNMNFTIKGAIAAL